MKTPEFTDYESLGFRDVVFERLHDGMMDYIYELPKVNTYFYKRSEALPREPGIYFVIRNGEIIYIGKSVNLSQRWQTHKLRSLWGEIEIFYQVYTDKNAEYMDADEAAFILILRPIHNQITGKINLNSFKRIQY